MKKPSMKFLVKIILWAICVGCSAGSSSIDLREASVLGDKSASLELIVFSDFQCTFCKRAAVEIKHLTAKYPNRIKVYFKHFPLHYHSQALNAAKAAEAARLQNKFWDMHDLLFEYSQELDNEIYLKLAKKLALDLDKFSKDFNSFETTNKVAADKAEGESIGVDGTPFFLIDGTVFNGAYTKIENVLKDR